MAEAALLWEGSLNATWQHLGSKETVCSRQNYVRDYAAAREGKRLHSRDAAQKTNF